MRLWTDLPLAAAACSLVTLVMAGTAAYAQETPDKEAETSQIPPNVDLTQTCGAAGPTPRRGPPTTEDCPIPERVDKSAHPGGPRGLPPPPLSMIVPSQSFNLGPPLGGPAAIGNIDPIFVMPPGMVGDLKPSRTLLGFGDLAEPRPAPDGFNHDGTEIHSMAGSYGRYRATVQTGQSNENYSAYFAGSTIKDPSWRDDTDGELSELYGDLGWRNETSNLHLTLSGLDGSSSGAGLTPVEMLADDRSSSFMSPSGDTDQRWKLQLSGEHEMDSGWTLSGKAYVGHSSRQKSWADGETPQACADDATTLCDMMGSPYRDMSGNRFPLYSTSGHYASLTEYSEETDTYGGSFEARTSEPLMGRPNDFVMGIALDGSSTSSLVTESLGEYTTSLDYTNDQGIYQSTSADLDALYFSLYAADQYSVTDRLTIGGALRFNVSDLDRYNASMTNVTYDYDLNEHKTFYSLDPSIGFTYKLMDDLVGYAGYNRESRAPTPFGTMCGSMASTCAFANFPAADEPLDQTHSDNFEVGVRAQNTVFGDTTLSWNFRLFSQQTEDTYWLVLRETRPMFSNVGDSWRRGMRFNAALASGPWTFGLDYILQKSTFEETFSVFSSDNPSADATGHITVPEGSEMPNIPNQILSLTADYAVNDRLNVGGTVTAVSGSYAQFDENNTLDKSDPFALLSLSARYKLSENAEIFGLVTNVFDTDYEVMGALMKVNSVPDLSLTNPLGYIPGDRRAFYAGLRVTF
ncbi:TonB-dependent receptor [Agrobacterium sp. a22-2]|uniref:TonB-dependent receptor n=1 Tax=Agrobacterium sp. a22-2 TaxID=2283840 RepID=UPI001444E274|nr:TonB-dependent receptor [Agrobacterium sp. a22-2]NKN38188.1 TonB-dependent receptor [Agrobacterium sp. a22-2]